MNIIEKNLNEIKPYEKNPRKNNNAVEYVANSIKEFGFKVPIVIDKDGVIVAGHTRYKASKKLGLEKVPCIIADDLTPEQIKAYRLADNKVSEKSEWDFDLLQDELSELNDLIDMSAFDFDVNIDVEKESSGEAQEDNFEPELPENPKAKLGDIYQLGNHRLMCGDSTNITDVEKLMDGVKADMLLTDPPYNVNYEGKAGKLENDNMDNDSFRQFLRDALSTANSVMRDGATFYIWHSDSEGYNFRGACNDVGWKVRQCLIWNKNAIVMGRQDYHWKHEPCLYGWKSGASHLWNSDRKQSTVIDMPKPAKSELHPTMKPIQLFDYQIKNNTKIGASVLDLFGGSGTTIMACEQNNRIAYTMELDPKYVDVIIERWEKFTGKKAKLITNADNTNGD